MPVEIRELVVKASIVDGNREAPPERQDSPAISRERLVETCVEQVLAILESKNER